MLSRNSGDNPHKDEKEAETTLNQTLTPQAEILIKKRQLPVFGRLIWMFLRLL
jgi:hypothetical protein